MSLGLLATPTVTICKVAKMVFNVAPGNFYLSQYLEYQEANGTSATVEALAGLAGGTDAAFITTVLTNLGLADDAGAQAFLESAVAANGRGAALEAAITALDGVAADDATYGAAKTAFDSAIVTSVSYSTNAANNSTDAATLAAAISGDGAASSTAVGQTFTLTANADTFTPNSATAATKTTSGDDTFRAPADGNWANADYVDGGLGTDTLSATITNASQTLTPATAGIEKIYITPTTAAGADLALAATDLSGVNQIWIKDAVDADNTDDADEEINITKVATSVTIGIDGGDSDGSGDNYIDTTIAFSSVTGSSDSATIALADAKTDVLTIASIETVTIQENASSATSDIESIVLDSAETLNIDADGKGVTIDAMTAANLATVDASGSTGKVSVNVDGGKANTTFTGGSGDDTILFGGTNIFDKDDTVTGGGGTDTLGIEEDEMETTKAFTNITGFETLKIVDATTGGETINLDHWAGITNVTFGAAATATTTVNNMVSGSTIGLATTSGVDLNLKTNGSDDTLNLDLNGAGVTYTVDASGFENLSVNTDDSTGTATLALTDVQLKEITLSQTKKTDQAVDLGSLGVVVSNVDLSGFEATTATNGVTVTLSTSAVNGATVTGSGNNDVINGSSQNDTINGGGGADHIKGEGGDDTLTGGAKTDVFEFSNNVGAGVMATITDFTLGDGSSHDDLEIHIDAFGFSQLIDGAGNSAVADGDAASLAELTGATTLVAQNVIVLSGATYADTDAVETAIEVGGDRAITFANATTAGDDILVGYYNGTDSYLAAVNIASAATTITAANATAANVVKLVGVDISESGALKAANFVAFET